MSRAIDTVLAYRLLKMLATPINKSDAFKLGIINAQGKKIKEPTTSQEKEAYTILNRFIFKVQKALTKSSDMNSKRLLTFAAALALLREYKDDDDDLTVQTMLELYMEDETVQQNAILLESNVVSFKDYFTEEVAANAVGGGNIHGMGVGAKGEPGVRTLAKWPFPGIGMPSLFRRKPVIKRKKKDANQ
tara:strand:- start:2347 stop:2913 length:567 start_codon:yes stop_codon:yes gene_type:complete